MTGRAVAAAPTRVGTMWLALVTVYLVWGSTYLAIRVVVRTAPPLLAMGVRFLVAGVLLAAVIAIRSGPRRLAVNRRQLAGSALVGLLLLLGGNGLVAVAEKTVPSGLAALVVASTPLWLVVLRLAVARERVARLSLLGTALGFAGIAALVLPGGLTGPHGTPVRVAGLLVVVAAAASWALGSFVSSRVPMPVDAFVATTWEMLAGGVGLVLAAAAAGESKDFQVGDVSGHAWFALGYLVVVGSIVAFSAYVWLLANAPISLTATYAYVNPVVAVALGALLLDEPISGAVLVGGAVVVAGVGLVVSSERPRRPPAPTECGPVEDGPEVVDLRT
jgi:drug/metabolite transporter (DMT)-like permease